MGSRNRILVIWLYSYPLTHLTSSRIVLCNCPIISILLLGFLQVSVSFRLFPETILNEFIPCYIHACQLPPNKTAQNKNPHQHLFPPFKLQSHAWFPLLLSTLASPPFQIVGSQGVSLWHACYIALPQVLEVICLPKADHRNLR